MRPSIAWIWGPLFAVTYILERLLVPLKGGARGRLKTTIEQECCLRILALKIVLDGHRLSKSFIYSRIWVFGLRSYLSQLSKFKWCNELVNLAGILEQMVFNDEFCFYLWIHYWRKEVKWRFSILRRDQ